jgi:hypothetical protein
MSGTNESSATDGISLPPHYNTTITAILSNFTPPSPIPFNYGDEDTNSQPASQKRKFDDTASSTSGSQSTCESHPTRTSGTVNDANIAAQQKEEVTPMEDTDIDDANTAVDNAKDHNTTNQTDQHFVYNSFFSFKRERSAMFKLAEKNTNSLSVSKQYFHDALASRLTHLPTTEHSAISERFSSYQKHLFSTHTKLEKLKNGTTVPKPLRLKQFIRGSTSLLETPAFKTIKEKEQKAIEAYQSQMTTILIDTAELEIKTQKSALSSS